MLKLNDFLMILNEYDMIKICDGDIILFYGLVVRCYLCGYGDKYVQSMQVNNGQYIINIAHL